MVLKLLTAIIVIPNSRVIDPLSIIACMINPLSTMVHTISPFTRAHTINPHGSMARPVRLVMVLPNSTIALLSLAVLLSFTVLLPITFLPNILVLLPALPITVPMNTAATPMLLTAIMVIRNNRVIDRLSTMARTINPHGLMALPALPVMVLPDSTSVPLSFTVLLITFLPNISVLLPALPITNPTATPMFVTIICTLPHIRRPISSNFIRVSVDHYITNLWCNLRGKRDT